MQQNIECTQDPHTTLSTPELSKHSYRDTGEGTLILYCQPFFIIVLSLLTQPASAVQSLLTSAVFVKGSNDVVYDFNCRCNFSLGPLTHK